MVGITRARRFGLPGEGKGHGLDSGPSTFRKIRDWIGGTRMDEFETQAACVEAVDDELLLFRIYLAEGEPRQAEEALTALYARHAGFLEAVCAKYGWEHPTRPARDFVNEAFAIVFRERPAFEPPGEATPESRRRAVRNFLCGICRLRYLKFYEKLRKERALDVVSLDGGWSVESVATPVTPEGLEGEANIPAAPTRAAIRRFFDTLDEENRIILTFSAQYIDLKSGRCEVPHCEARRLAALVGLELPAIRQRRKRMLDRIKAILDELPGTAMKGS